VTTPIAYCDECRHHHIPGPCDPNDLTDEGWNLYRALKLVTFPKRDSEQNLKAGRR
jgi:hypothetical protein